MQGQARIGQSGQLAKNIYLITKAQFLREIFLEIIKKFHFKINAADLVWINLRLNDSKYFLEICDAAADSVNPRTKNVSPADTLKMGF